MSLWIAQQECTGQGGAGIPAARCQRAGCYLNGGGGGAPGLSWISSCKVDKTVSPLTRVFT